MAEINKIEIDGVGYTITAPREVLTEQDVEYTCVWDEEYGEGTFMFTLNSGYDNKYITLDVTKIMESVGANLEDSKLAMFFPKLTNTKILVYSSYEENKDINSIEFNFSGYLIINDTTDTKGWYGYGCQVDNSYCQREDSVIQEMYIFEFDEIGICNLMWFTDGYEM